MTGHAMATVLSTTRPTGGLEPSVTFPATARVGAPLLLGTVPSDLANEILASLDPDEIVFAPPRTNFSSRGKLLDGDKAAKELEQGRFGIRNRTGDSDNDRSRDSRGNPLRRRGDSDYDAEGWSTVKPRKSFGAEGAERFSGKMGGNYRDETKSTDRDGAKDRQGRGADALGRDKDRDADGRTRNGQSKKLDSWQKTEPSTEAASNERRDRDRTKSWRDREPETPVDNSRGGDKRWGRERDQRAERDPEWFDEPAKDQRDVHTQQDFQKWMEQMKKAKNAQDIQSTDDVEPEKPAVKSAPAVEQGPDKFFMAFGGGSAMDSSPQTDQPDGSNKAKTVGKSSRFTSFFGGGQEDARQRTEPATPATGAPSVPPGLAHLLGGMGGAAGRGGSAGPEDEKQAFQQLLAKLQKQSATGTPPGLSLFSPPQQNQSDGGKKSSAVTSPEPFQQLGQERREGPTARPQQQQQQQEIHAPRPQQHNARPDQLLQDLVGHHQRASSQSSSQRDPSTAKNNSNAEFLMNLMRAGPADAHRAEQLQNMMARPGPMQQKHSAMPPMHERDAHGHQQHQQQQGRPGPPPGFPAMDDSYRSSDQEPRQNPTQILQRPPPPPGLDHMPPNWMHGPPPPGVGPPPGQRGGGPMIPPPGLPGGLPTRNMPMPHMFPPNFPPGAMPPHPPPDMARNMPPMPPPGFFNGPPPMMSHGYGPPPPGMPGFNNGPPLPDHHHRAFGSPPFDGRGMPPPPSADGGRSGNYGHGR